MNGIPGVSLRMRLQRKKLGFPDPSGIVMGFFLSRRTKRFTRFKPKSLAIQYVQQQFAVRQSAPRTQAVSIPFDSPQIPAKANNGDTGRINAGKNTIARNNSNPFSTRISEK